MDLTPCSSALTKTPHMASQLQWGHEERECGRRWGWKCRWMPGCKWAWRARDGLDFSLNTLKSSYSFVSNIVYLLTGLKQQLMFSNVFVAPEWTDSLGRVGAVPCSVMRCPAWNTHSPGCQKCWLLVSRSCVPITSISGMWHALSALYPFALAIISLEYLLHFILQDFLGCLFSPQVGLTASFCFQSLLLIMGVWDLKRFCISYHSYPCPCPPMHCVLRTSVQAMSPHLPSCHQRFA